MPKNYHLTPHHANILKRNINHIKRHQEPIRYTERNKKREKPMCWSRIRRDPSYIRLSLEDEPEHETRPERRTRICHNTALDLLHSACAGLFVGGLGGLVAYLHYRNAAESLYKDRDILSISKDPDLRKLAIYNEGAADQLEAVGIELLQFCPLMGSVVGVLTECIMKVNQIYHRCCRG